MSFDRTNGPKKSSSLATKEAPSRVRAAPMQLNCQPHEKLNLRFLICIVVVGLLLTAVWFGVNRWQIRRHAADLLNLADQAKALQRPDRAAHFLSLYVGMVPNDTQARARYGLLLERLADSPGARYGVLAVFEQVLIRDPERQDLRRRAAKLAVELGRAGRRRVSSDHSIRRSAQRRRNPGSARPGLRRTRRTSGGRFSLSKGHRRGAPSGSMPICGWLGSSAIALAEAEMRKRRWKN